MHDDDANSKVWSIRDLRIFNELQKPVAFVVHGLGKSPHRSDGAIFVPQRPQQNSGVLGLTARIVQYREFASHEQGHPPQQCLPERIRAAKVRI